MFFMTQRVAESMLTRQRGRVINIGSVTSVFGYAGLGPYCASRGGVKQLTMSMADEFGPTWHYCELPCTRLVSDSAERCSLSG